jgi:hypothetical protein
MIVVQHSTDHNISTDGSQLFPSLDALRKTHLELATEHRKTEDRKELLSKVIDFICKGKATGKLINDDDDRYAAQSFLDYWVAMLYREGKELPDNIDAILDDIDTDLVPKLEENPYPGPKPFE